jgi:hypothetical protein
MTKMRRETTQIYKIRNKKEEMKTYPWKSRVIIRDYFKTYVQINWKI